MSEGSEGVDDGKLEQLLQYLCGTHDKCLRLKPGDINVCFYVDASYESHQVCESHTGIVRTIGYATVYAKSKKQGTEQMYSI
jgi:hypothetical protein